MDNTQTAIGYARVSTDEQGASGLGLDVQRRAITAECERRGWPLSTIREDVASGRSCADRPGLAEAVAAVERGEAHVLVVSKLDRLSRSLADFASLMDGARREGWSLVALDLGIDTSTPQGEMMANVLATFAQFERRLIGERTREALAVARARGVLLGRPRVMDEKVRERIRRLRRRGWSYGRIAERLNLDGVPTAHGGASWHAATIRAAVSPAGGATAAPTRRAVTAP